MDEQTTYTERKTVIDHARGFWQDFGPLVLGVAVFLVILAGGWYLWKNSIQTRLQPPTVTEEELDEALGGLADSTTVPQSEVTLPSTATPTPTPAPSATPSYGALPSATPKVVAQTKGGQPAELPKSGPELALLPFALVGAGALLRKLFKKS